jgi:hypothetical protein
MWGFEDAQDPSCVKSRTGFIIFIQSCPVLWMSKLQTDVATSTMESEYKVFRMNMREVLPLQILTKTIVKALGLEGIGLTEFKATITKKINLKPPCTKTMMELRS